MISDLRFSFLKLCLIVLCVHLAVGCAPVKAPPKAIPASPAEVLDKISRKNIRDKDLRGVARITFRCPEGIFTARYAVLSRFPDALRVESIPPIGPPDLFLVIKGESLKVFIPGKKVFYIGKASRQNLSHFLPFPLEAREIIPVLMGALPPDFPGEKSSLKGRSENGLYRMDVFSGEKRLRSSWVDLSSGELTRVEFQESGEKTICSAKLDDYKMIDGIAFPQKIDLQFDTEGVEPLMLHIVYSDLQLSSGEDAALYDLEVPSGVKPIFLN